MGNWDWLSLSWQVKIEGVYYGIGIAYSLDSGEEMLTP